MEDPARENSYEEAKRKAKEFYRGIGRVWCPALNGYVAFNSAGFRHLVWKGAEQRPQKEQERRFGLIFHARNILAVHHGEVEFREKIEMSIVRKHGIKIRRPSRARFWGFLYERGGETITIVIRQIDRRSKHFFSIY
ncbi:MAG: hypothetical protein WCF77_00090 [Minisyncoccia bacterium]|jgi:hypothetical protein